MYSIILGILGFILTRKFYGAIVGFMIGGYVDSMVARKNASKGGSQNSKQRSNFSGFGQTEDIFDYYRNQSQRFDFATSLLALSAYVMRSDGKVVKAELNFVKSFLAQQFGNNFSVQHLQSLKRFLDEPTIPIEQICADIRSRMQQDVRVHLMHYLFGIAKADGQVSDQEVKTLERLAHLLQIGKMDFKSVQGMFTKHTDSDYDILGIPKSSSDDEVKKAYRQLAIRFHPDKVASLGEEFQKGAKEKFQNVQEAYENIKKSRGF